MNVNFIYEIAWRFMTLTMAAAAGFAFIINRIRREPDAQLPNRQAAGWFLILASIGSSIALEISVFYWFGYAAAIASLFVAVLGGGLFVLLADLA
jgi:hypothetical protein